MRLRFWLKGLSTVAALLVSSALLVAATDQGQVGPPSSASRNQASILLEQIGPQAVHVRDLADQLQTYEVSPLRNSAAPHSFQQAAFCCLPTRGRTHEP